MYGVIFLIVLALVWLVFASIQDLRQREVADWLSFSLIIFALGARLFYSLFNNNFRFFYEGLIGFGIFFILANLLYYGRMFAGADAKLMMALGAILPFSENFFINLKILFAFLFIFLFAGGFYGLTWSIILGIKDYKKFTREFPRQFHKNKKMIYAVMFLGLFVIVLGFMINFSLAFYFGILIFIFPYLFLYAKSVDEACMVRKIPAKKLTEGDWLYKDVRIRNRIIKSTWGGVNKEEISLLKKHKKEVMVRYGIPFVPVFLISFLILLYLFYSGYLEVLWNYFSNL